MYRKLIKKISLLVAISLIFTLLFAGIYRLKVDKIRIDKDTKILICGDSHTRSAINDSILKNSVNISQSGEPYLYTYNVIKVVLKNNPQINTVIMGFGFHNVSALYDCVIFDSTWTSVNYPKYLPILDQQSLSVLINNNMDDVVRYAPNVYRDMRSSIFKPSDINSWPFIGGYYKSYKSNVTEEVISSTIVRHFYKKYKKGQDFSSIQENYLKLIAKYCKEKNIRLVLVNTPITTEYYEKIPQKFITKYYKLADELKNGIVFLDFHDMKLRKRFYGDGDHINAYGAEIFSKKMDMILNKGKNFTESL